MVAAGVGGARCDRRAVARLPGHGPDRRFTYARAVYFGTYPPGEWLCIVERADRAGRR